MTAQVVAIVGPAGAGKTAKLLARYQQSLIGGGIRPLQRLWFAPTPRAAASIRDLLAAQQRACFSPGIATFDDLAKQVVLAAGRRIHIVSPVQQRELLRRIVSHSGERGQLSFFAAAAQRRSFIELLVAHFRELRQRDIDAQSYERLAIHDGRPFHKELATLYRDYDRQLETNRLSDAAGMLTMARDALSSGACQKFDRLELVVVDSFTDFTQIEWELLRQLGARSQQLYISLVSDDAHPCADLFAKTTATLADLSRVFPALEVTRLPSRPSANIALNHITNQVFRYPHARPSPDVVAALPSLEIVAAASAPDEIVQLARRIKRLLTQPCRATASDGAKQGAGPGDIVVIFRSVTEVASRVEEVFKRFGIPVYLETRPRIARTAIYRAYNHLLKVLVDDWPFRGVVSLITNRLLTLFDEPSRRAADWLVRDLQIASGRRSLSDAVASLASQQAEIDHLSEHQRRRVAAAVQCQNALSQLAAALEELPESATPTQWLDALVTLGDTVGLSPFMANAPARPNRSDSSAVAAEARAWQVLRAHLAAIERLDVWLGEPTRRRDRREFQTLLQGIASTEPLPRTGDESGCVRVLSAQSARTITARHVFLAGMSEQVFPAGEPSNSLATDGEYRFLANVAHRRAGDSGGGHSPVANHQRNRSSHSREEMLLFYEVISRAQESLTISYPALDEKAQDLPPSPYVIELQRIFRHSEQQIPCSPPQLSPVPHVAASLRDANSSADTVFSLADWRIAATAAAATTDGDRRLLAGLLAQDATKPLAQAIDSGIRTVHARARGEAFGPCEGVLNSPAVAERLGQRFSLRHTWSPSQFETYAACPYKFFLEIVLGLEPIGDLVLETDFARRGSLVHQVLALFHRKYSESPSEWLAISRDEMRFEAEIKLALQSVFAGAPETGIEAALAELDRRQINKWTDAYRDQYDKYDRAWANLDEPPRPAHFELRFGRKHSGEDGYEDPNSVDNSFQLDLGGEKIHVAGRIDRIDVGQASGRTVFNVIDYKSGIRPTLTSEKIESGERLQPALYVMAAQALIFGNEQATPLWAGYWSLKNGVTTRKGYSLHCSVESGELTREWNDLQPKVIARIAEIVRSARRGAFPVHSSDVNCTSRCDFKTVCRVGQVRSVGKVRTPPTGDA